MATRERKPSFGRKQSTSSPVPPKDNLISMENESTIKDDEQNVFIKNISGTTATAAAAAAATTKTLTKKLSNKNVKKLTKKATVAIKLKPKITNKKINVKQKLVKAMLNTKNVENKKKLMKNGVRKLRKAKQTPKLAAVTATTTTAAAASTTKDSDDDLPPVLEPIFNIENENISQPTKRKVGRPPGSTNKTKKVKLEVTKKVEIQKKLKEPPPSESLDDVMNDLSFLIKNNETKKESDGLSESSKSDTMTKSKKLTKKKLMQNKLIKKENIENTLNKLNPIDNKNNSKVIDMLDLNVVDKLKKKLPKQQRRRHSIEKFPLGENSDTSSIELSIFNNLPRSISPRSKRLSKLRQSVDGFNRRLCPYTTRSDSPARILRNGKHRKLNVGLLDGLDIIQKKRKRQLSDFSGSEISKLSGYESDSSFSDLSSIHGAENFENNKEFDNKNKIIIEDDATIKTNNGPIETDTNSNLCTNTIKTENDAATPATTTEAIATTTAAATTTPEKIVIKTETGNNENISGSPSLKVPEKSIILDIMKQTFNHVEANKEQKSCTNSTGGSNNKQTEEGVTASVLYSIKTEATKANSDGDADVVDKQQQEEENEEKEKNVEDEECEEIIIKTIEDESQTIEQISEEIASNIPHPEVQEVVMMKEVEVENVPIKSEIEIGEEKNNGAEKPIEVVEEEEGEAAVVVVVKENCDEANNTSENRLENVSGENNDNTVGNNVDLLIPEETPENLAVKENILHALGLQSLKAAEEAKLKNKEKIVNKNDNYTGTLKTVIKISRERKKGRNPLKMTLQKNKSKDCDAVKMEDGYKIMQGASTSNWKHGGQSSDTAGAHRKSHYSNRSNMDGSSEHTSDGEGTSQEGATKSLVIPEKASSFSIHPGRLCKDECSYCFGKFGLFDTPCHIAQMKSVDRQDKILAAEKHLTRDSCLCDACYRHVDRKSNTPSYTNKSYKRSAMVAPGPRQDHCHVLNCDKIATNILRRKWIIKMRKSICQVINIDLDNPGLHSIPICDEHYFALEHLMVCAMCKRRLARNHVHYLGPETVDLNAALNAEGIPLILTDKPVVCKLCKCFATVILKSPDDRPENSSNFFIEYKKRLLHFNDIVPMDEAAAEEPIAVPSKEKYEKDQIKKKKKLTKTQLDIVQNDTTQLLDLEKSSCDQNRVPSSDSNNQSRSESPSDYMIDYNTLIPSIAMECGSDTESKKDNNIIKKSSTTATTTILKKIPRPETVKEAVEISKNMKLKNDKNSDIAVQRLGSNPSISVRQLFPCEEDLPLQASIDFGNIKERTPEGWEKCSSIIQYDMETKHLWQELQKPYGNQSSFLRHLILLEKYFRNGDLILSSNASHHSVNYSESVQNRLKAYDNIPTNLNGNNHNNNNNNNNNSSQHQLPQQSLSILPYNNNSNSKPQKSNSGIITSTNLINKEIITQQSSGQGINAANIPKNTPLTISQLNSPPLIPTTVTGNISKSKSVGAPPGLISLHPGTNKPMAPLIKVPQSQKIKFPITKNWRPNLIPIDPNKKPTERKAGLVQVISGGKPYHITLDDYKKMCAIKKSFDLKQKRLQEASNCKSVMVKCNSVLKTIVPRKGLIISKTTTSTITSPKNDVLINNNSSELADNSLEKLDQQVEKLEAKFNENNSNGNSSSSNSNNNKTTTSLVLPKIPKSLTVIPQTVKRNKPSRPTSPVLLITQKPKSIVNKS